MIIIISYFIYNNREMVRNINGGNKAKSKARKDTTEVYDSTSIRLPENELEDLAYVNKCYGNGRFEITTTDGNKISCIVRGKHKGKHRRNNLVAPGSLILVGLREWENPRKTSDLITTYSPFEIDKIKTIPGLNISQFPLDDVLGIANNNTSESNFIFTNNTDDRATNNIPVQKHTPTVTVQSETVDDYDFDDI
jgi:translation initiation factor IF-1